MTVYAEREGFVRFDVETAYGTDPGTGTNLYVEEATIDSKRMLLPRNGPSPYRAGYAPVVGPADVSWSAKVEMVETSMTDSPTERPIEDGLLKAVQFKPTASGGAANPDKVVYALQSHHEGTTSGTESSATMTIVEFNSDDDDGWFRKAKGCRGDVTFDITPAERWYLSGSGVAQAFANTSIEADQPGVASRTDGVNANVYDFSDQRAIAGEGECLIKALTAGETYPATGRVVSFSFNANNSPTIKRGVCGQKASNIGGNPTATLVLEVQDAGDFDVQQYQGQQGSTIQTPDAILVQIASRALTFNVSGVPTITTVTTPALPAGTYDYILFRCHFYIESISMGGDSAAKTWTLNLVGAYAPGTVAGDTASEGMASFEYGTYTIA